MKKHNIAVVLILCLICLTGCGLIGIGGGANGDFDALPEISDLAERMRSERESVSTGQYEENDEDDKISPIGSGVLIREDAEGLISVRIEDGRAELVYDLDRWDSLHDIYENSYYPIEEIIEGPFLIVTSNGGRIKDACIGKIDDLFMGYLSLRDFITPTVALLMEDGSVEFTRADPFMGVYMFGDTSLYSHGKLPWLEDIVSLSYENEKEGIGGMTIFAEDKYGLLYNVQRLYTMVGIFEDEWLFRQDREGFPEWRYCILKLVEGYSVPRAYFETGLTDGWGIGNYGKYEGYYEISLAENAPGDGRRPGLITFDLTMTGGDTEHDWIFGTYFIQLRDGITMELWHSDGDHLAYMDGEPLTDFYFFRPNDPEYDFWGSEHSADSEPISAYEAWVIYDLWLESHLEMSQFTIDLHSYDICEVDGEYYYWFQADNMEWYWYNILVNMQSGEMLFMMTPDGEEPMIEIELLEDYYSRYFG